MTPTPKKWIESKAGIIAILQHGADVAQSYQFYLDMVLPNDAPENFETWVETISESNYDVFCDAIATHRRQQFKKYTLKKIYYGKVA